MSRPRVFLAEDHGAMREHPRLLFHAEFEVIAHAGTLWTLNSKGEGASFFTSLPTSSGGAS
jgi:hypothetical protein